LSDLKLYDYRNRMYQPELGRFLQPDPKEFAAGDYNLYRYCHNDPVNRNDPFGLRDETFGELLKKTAIDYANGVGSYVRGVGRGIDALAGLSGLKGEQAQAEQKQALADIGSATTLGIRGAIEHPNIAQRAVVEGGKAYMQNHGMHVAGRFAAGRAAGAVPVPLGGRIAVPLGMITTPLAIYGDATHAAISLRQAAQVLHAEHLLDSALTGGTNEGH
jgi:uncharacterized protein RhaS with RHS repeats